MTDSIALRTSQIQELLGCSHREALGLAHRSGSFRVGRQLCVLRVNLAATLAGMGEPPLGEVIAHLLGESALHDALITELREAKPEPPEAA